MHSIYLVLHSFFDICRFRRAPQHLPTSNLFMWLIITTYTLLNFITSSLELDLHTALLISLGETLLLLILISSLLYTTKRIPRLTQTLTALIGCSLVINLLSLPFILWLIYAQQITLTSDIASITLLLLFFWSIAIDAHILRHALTIPYYTALGIALFITIILISALQQLLPIAITTLPE